MLYIVQAAPPFHLSDFCLKATARHILALVFSFVAIELHACAFPFLGRRPGGGQAGQPTGLDCYLKSLYTEVIGPERSESTPGEIGIRRTMPNGSAQRSQNQEHLGVIRETPTSTR